MDMEIFMKKRQEMKFSLEDVSNLLNKLGYQNCVVETGIIEGVEKKTENECFKAFCWENQKQGSEELKKRLELKEVPEHFAYIKFYSEGSNAKNDNEIWALVAGKGNKNDSDLRFQEFATEKSYRKKIENISDPKVIHRKLPGDLSKIWLYEHKESKWFTEMILVFWKDISNDENVSLMAFKAEADIGGLLGLFNS